MLFMDSIQNLGSKMLCKEIMKLYHNIYFLI